MNVVLFVSKLRPQNNQYQTCLLSKEGSSAVFLLVIQITDQIYGNVKVLEPW